MKKCVRVIFDRKTVFDYVRLHEDLLSTDFNILVDKQKILFNFILKMRIVVFDNFRPFFLIFLIFTNTLVDVAKHKLNKRTQSHRSKQIISNKLYVEVVHTN